jgi:hypothetical protein
MPGEITHCGWLTVPHLTADNGGPFGVPLWQHNGLSPGSLPEKLRVPLDDRELCHHNVLSSGLCTSRETLEGLIATKASQLVRQGLDPFVIMDGDALERSNWVAFYVAPK